MKGRLTLTLWAVLKKDPVVSDTASLEARRLRGREARYPQLDYGMLPESVGYALRKAQIVVSQQFAAAVAPHDVTPGQFSVLVLIRENAGLSQSELGSAVGIDRSTMVAVIDRLEARGLVVRAPSPNDRRSYALRLSPTGEHLVQDLIPRVAGHERQIAGGLTHQEQKHLIDILNRIAAAG